MSVSSISGLRYNQKVIAPGAQTERRGDAGPVRSLLRGKPHRPLFFIKTHRAALVPDYGPPPHSGHGGSEGTQVPPEQYEMESQALKHAPQFCESLHVST